MSADSIRRTGDSQLPTPPSSSESGPVLGRKLRLLEMFSSLFCRRISTCCSSRRRLSSSCFKPPLLLYSADGHALVVIAYRLPTRTRQTEGFTHHSCAVRHESP